MAFDERGRLEAEVAALRLALAESNQLIVRLEAEVSHWKSNHVAEVRRARVLKERTDMPIERVQAYERWGMDQEVLVNMVHMLEEAAEVFSQYAALHAAKPYSEENREKVNRNLDMARKCREATRRG